MGHYIDICGHMLVHEGESCSHWNLRGWKLAPQGVFVIMVLTSLSFGWFRHDISSVALTIQLTTAYYSSPLFPSLPNFFFSVYSHTAHATSCYSACLDVSGSAAKFSFLADFTAQDSQGIKNNSRKEKNISFWLRQGYNFDELQWPQARIRAT